VKAFRYWFSEATFGQTEVASHLAFSSRMEEVAIPWGSQAGLLAALATEAVPRFGDGLIIPASALVAEVRDVPTCPTIDEGQAVAELKVPYGAFSGRVAAWEAAIPAAFQALGDARGETPLAAVFGNSAGNNRRFADVAVIFGRVDDAVEGVAAQLRQLTVSRRRFDGENLAYQKHLIG